MNVSLENNTTLVFVVLWDDNEEEKTADHEQRDA